MPAVTANIRFRIEYVEGGVVQPFGRGFEPYTFSSSGGRTIRQIVTVGNGNTETLLNIGSGATDDLASFGLFAVISSQDVLIEFKGTTAADNSNLKIKANLPFLINSDDTLAYNASGAFAGAAQDITQIRVKNSSGSSADIDFVAIGL